MFLQACVYASWFAAAAEGADIPQCPARAMVEAAALEASGRTPAAAALTWSLQPSNGRLRVTVNDLPQAPHTRFIERAQQTCEELAQAVAVVWVTAHLQDQEVAVDLPSFTADAPAPSPTLDAPLEVLREQDNEQPMLLATPAPTSQTSALSFEAEGAGLASWSGANTTATAHLGLAIASPRLVGFRVAGEHTFSMRSPVAPGYAQWRRWTAALGLFQRWKLNPNLRFEVEPSLLLSRLQMSGSGFSSDRSGAANDVGSRMSARFAWVGGVASPFLVLTGEGWFGQKDMFVQNVSGTQTVPRWTISAGAGVMWGGLKNDLASP